MFTEINNIKSQLAELAASVNAFKSEAVQLKVVELLFQKLAVGDPLRDNTESKRDSGRLNRKRARAKVAKSPGIPGNGKRSSRRSVGSVAALGRMLEGGYFKQARTLADMVQHSTEKLAIPMKQNEISGKLARLVRDGTLARTKNADGQFEYTQK
jgi:hypothetical protein